MCKRKTDIRLRGRVVGFFLLISKSDRTLVVFGRHRFESVAANQGESDTIGRFREVPFPSFFEVSTPILSGFLKHRRHSADRVPVGL